MSLPETFQLAAARPVAPIDIDRLWQRGRRRRRRAQAAVGAAIVAAAAIGWLVVPGLLPAERPAVTFAPGAETTPATSAPSVEAPSTTQPGWEDLSLTEAIERLVAVNESAPPPPATEGIRVTRTVAAFSNTTVDNESSRSVLDVGLRELRLHPDGSGVIADAPIAQGLDPGTSAERLREIVASSDLDSLPLQEDGYGPGELSFDLPALLDEAETLAAASPSPLPEGTETERTPQAQAALAVIESMWESVPSPQDRIRALRIIGGLDPSLVEYRGIVQDLLGREGIGIAFLDSSNPTTDTMIFSPETGELLGVESSFLPSPPAEPPGPQLLGLTAILEASITPQ